ncbi:hypothetical protein DL93DRAFT_2227152 [Clavulina sp. PMI_390]|nr:hypothetical protein DL93DRAFT_2227152 [Clavulina sp. PMI_390]
MASHHRTHSYTDPNAHPRDQRHKENVLPSLLEDGPTRGRPPARRGRSAREAMFRYDVWHDGTDDDEFSDHDIHIVRYFSPEVHTSPYSLDQETVTETAPDLHLEQSHSDDSFSDISPSPPPSTAYESTTPLPSSPIESLSSIQFGHAQMHASVGPENADFTRMISLELDSSPATSDEAVSALGESLQRSSPAAFPDARASTQGSRRDAPTIELPSIEEVEVAGPSGGGEGSAQILGQPRDDCLAPRSLYFSPLSLPSKSDTIVKGSPFGEGQALASSECSSTHTTLCTSIIPSPPRIGSIPLITPIPLKPTSGFAENTDTLEPENIPPVEIAPKSISQEESVVTPKALFSPEALFLPQPPISPLSPSLPIAPALSSNPLVSQPNPIVQMLPSTTHSHNHDHNHPNSVMTPSASRKPRQAEDVPPLPSSAGLDFLGALQTGSIVPDANAAVANDLVSGDSFAFAFGNSALMTLAGPSTGVVDPAPSNSVPESFEADFTMLQTADSFGLARGNRVDSSSSGGTTDTASIPPSSTPDPLALVRRGKAPLKLSKIKPCAGSGVDVKAVGSSLDDKLSSTPGLPAPTTDTTPSVPAPDIDVPSDSPNQVSVAPHPPPLSMPSTHKLSLVELIAQRHRAKLADDAAGIVRQPPKQEPEGEDEVVEEVPKADEYGRPYVVEHPWMPSWQSTSVQDGGQAAGSDTIPTSMQLPLNPTAHTEVMEAESITPVGDDDDPPPPPASTRPRLYPVPDGTNVPGGLVTIPFNLDPFQSQWFPRPPAISQGRHEAYSGRLFTAMTYDDQDNTSIPEAWNPLGSAYSPGRESRDQRKAEHYAHAQSHDLSSAEGRNDPDEIALTINFSDHPPRYTYLEHMQPWVDDEGNIDPSVMDEAPFGYKLPTRFRSTKWASVDVVQAVVKKEDGIWDLWMALGADDRPKEIETAVPAEMPISAGSLASNSTTLKRKHSTLDSLAAHDTSSLPVAGGSPTSKKQKLSTPLPTIDNRAYSAAMLPLPDIGCSTHRLRSPLPFPLHRHDEVRSPNDSIRQQLQRGIKRWAWNPTTQEDSQLAEHQRWNMKLLLQRQGYLAPAPRLKFDPDSNVALAQAHFGITPDPKEAFYMRYGRDAVPDEKWERPVEMTLPRISPLFDPQYYPKDATPEERKILFDKQTIAMDNSRRATRKEKIANYNRYISELKSGIPEFERVIEKTEQLIRRDPDVHADPLPISHPIPKSARAREKQRASDEPLPYPRKELSAMDRSIIHSNQLMLLKKMRQKARELQEIVKAFELAQGRPTTENFSTDALMLPSAAGDHGNIGDFEATARFVNSAQEHGLFSSF